jgi:hypothetical protein
MKPVLVDVGPTVVDSKEERSKNTIDVNNLHKILGHCGEVSARLTGKALGYVKRAPSAKQNRKASISIGKEVVPKKAEKIRRNMCCSNQS